MLRRDPCFHYLNGYPDVRPVTSGPETSFDIARIQRAADILVLPSDLLPEPECDPDSADTSCDVSVQSR
jgi:hypothetical protein